MIKIGPLRSFVAGLSSLAFVACHNPKADQSIINFAKASAPVDTVALTSDFSKIKAPAKTAIAEKLATFKLFGFGKAKQTKEGFVTLENTVAFQFNKKGAIVKQTNFIGNGESISFLVDNARQQGKIEPTMYLYKYGKDAGVPQNQVVVTYPTGKSEYFNADNGKLISNE
jgi:hypothetical protein